MPCCGTPTPWPPGTALPSPAKQVLPFIFGWRRGCKRSPVGAQPHCKHLQTYCSPSAACCGQGAGRQLWYPLPTQTPQTACGCCVRPRVRGLAGPTHHVLSRACCFSCSSRFRLSTSTFSSIFCGEGGRWVGCPHSCPDPPVPLPTGMHQRWHGGPPPHSKASGAHGTEWHGWYFSLLVLG